MPSSGVRSWPNAPSFRGWHQVRPRRLGEHQPGRTRYDRHRHYRRAKLIAFVEANGQMSAEAKERTLTRLSEPMVPVRMVRRLESRMGS